MEIPDSDLSESEKQIRFALGAVVGAAIGFALIYSYGIVSQLALAFVLIIPMLTFGYLAMLFGMRLWHLFKDYAD